MKDLFNQDIAEITISYSCKIPAKDRRVVQTSLESYHVFLPFFAPTIELKESFFVMYMNRANQVLGVYMISSGGMSGTVADPKMIFQTALKAHSAHIIVAHNHPSGNKNPSEADINLTNKIEAAAKNLDMKLLDHIILTPESYFSFADEGYIHH